MTQSLLLDVDVWDVLADINGNIAVASDPYRIAQDVATEARLFKGEYWYDTTLGIPYFQQVLGRFPPAPLLKRLYVNAAKAVVGVVSAQFFISAIVGRKLTGQIQSTDQTGNVLPTSV